MTCDPPSSARLSEFATAIGTIIEDSSGLETAILPRAIAQMQALVAQDDWLHPAFAIPGDSRYHQYPLFIDDEGRFSIVSFVWGPGQQTPVHDHTVWGVIGMLRGAEISEAYALGHDVLEPRGETRLDAGQVMAVSPSIGDIHRVRNAFDDRVSVSIHCYGGDIGTINRHIFLPDGTTKPFVSAYSPVDGHRPPGAP